MDGSVVMFRIQNIVRIRVGNWGFDWLGVVLFYSFFSLLVRGNYYDARQNDRQLELRHSLSSIRSVRVLIIHRLIDFRDASATDSALLLSVNNLGEHFLRRHIPLLTPALLPSTKSCAPP